MRRRLHTAAAVHHHDNSARTAIKRKRNNWRPFAVNLDPEIIGVKIRFELEVAVEGVHQNYWVRAIAPERGAGQ
jgi:hypothetical protein